VAGAREGFRGTRACPPFPWFSILVTGPCNVCYCQVHS